jgi:hypothetical protein
MRKVVTCGAGGRAGTLQISDHQGDRMLWKAGQAGLGSLMRGNGHAGWYLLYYLPHIQWCDRERPCTYSSRSKPFAQHCWSKPTKMPKCEERGSNGKDAVSCVKMGLGLGLHFPQESSTCRFRCTHHASTRVRYCYLTTRTTSLGGRNWAGLCGCKRHEVTLGGGRMVETVGNLERLAWT